MDDSSPWIDLTILLFLILINGFFSASELAIVSLNDNRIKKKAEEGDQQALTLMKLTENPSEFLATVQVGVTLAGFLSSAFAADKFAHRLATLIDPQGLYVFVKPTSLVVLTLVLSYFSLVFGELVPKRLAMRNPEILARRFLPIILLFDRLLRPITRFLGFSTNVVLKVLGVQVDRAETSVTEEEIRMMIDVGQEEGSIHDSEKEMIENIFDFNDKEVSEIMTHRTKVTALELSAPLEEVMHVLHEEKFSRLPVYEDSLDNIVGILNIKDVLSYMVSPNKPAFHLKNLIRPPYVTPESKTIDSLFREMQKARAQIAVVIDEYGGTAGIVTVEDLLEEIVGNILDEYDEEAPNIVPVSEEKNTYLVNGLCETLELERYFSDVVLLHDEEDFDTVAGLVLNLLERIPEADEHPVVRLRNMEFEVLEMEEKRIAKLKFRLLDTAQTMEQAEELALEEE